MAVVVKEQFNSRRITKTGSNVTGERIFRVFDDANPITTPDAVIALFGTVTTPDAMPAVGHGFPGFIGLFAFDYTVHRVQGHTDLFEVKWQYRNLTISDPDEPEPGDPGYVQITIEPSRNFVNVWRTEPDLIITADGAVTNSNEVDIDGTKADLAGEPVSELVARSRVVITEVRETPIDLSVYRDTVQRRNEFEFLGAPKGKLVYQPPRIHRIAFNKFQITHEFIEDEWFHMRQTVRRFANGDPVLDTDNPPHAKEVYWRQPFTQFANYSLLNIPPL